MTTDLHNLNDALAFLESKAIHTSQGTFVRVEDVKEALNIRSYVAAIEEAEAPRPKTMAQAQRMVRHDPEIMKEFPSRVAPPGRSVPAMSPESPSRA